MKTFFSSKHFDWIIVFGQLLSISRLRCTFDFMSIELFYCLLIINFFRLGNNKITYATNHNISLDTHFSGGFFIACSFPLSVNRIKVSFLIKCTEIFSQALLSADPHPQPWHYKLTNAWVWITILYRFTLAGELESPPKKSSNKQYEKETAKSKHWAAACAREMLWFYLMRSKL